ncbi:potassium channel family protein [Nocardioides sp. S-58]|uniref:Potassium channel family protein n=1 Tax=Nocardioides renjunii TaxID=3095075 RepID=A0ABU5KB37_9ACTN|nr:MULTISPECIES: potassium channel family protein [unclassified Nocardioides]MDZ5662178.1 potassium channel family protein [Nocardioides sp. S-58]WQQ20358.1 potassium channel family protein [Nocardioides sp. S-34]
MTHAREQSQSTGTGRPPVARGVARALASTTAVCVLYFVLPLDHLGRLPVGVGLLAALGALVVVTVWQVHAVTRSTHPGVRAVEALAVILPVFLVLFAVSYYLLTLDDPDSFTAGALTRTDALYFTVTVFATVGFGDIAAVTQQARRLVTVQMVLDLLLIGVVIRVFVGAVERGRSRDGR